MKLLILALCFAAASSELVLLTADEGAIIKSTWNQVKHNEVDILYNVFKENPDIQAKFSQFAGKDLDSIKDTGAFATHATRIISFMSEVLALGESESNIPASKFLVNNLATSHKSRGITKAQFNEFRASILKYIEANVSWGENVSAAWTKSADNFFFLLFSALDA